MKSLKDVAAFMQSRLFPHLKVPLWDKYLYGLTGDAQKAGRSLNDDQEALHEVHFDIRTLILADYLMIQDVGELRNDVVRRFEAETLASHIPAYLEVIALVLNLPPEYQQLRQDVLSATAERSAIGKDMDELESKVQKALTRSGESPENLSQQRAQSAILRRVMTTSDIRMTRTPLSRANLTIQNQMFAIKAEFERMRAEILSLKTENKELEESLGRLKPELARWKNWGPCEECQEFGPRLRTRRLQAEDNSFELCKYCLNRFRRVESEFEEGGK